MVTPGQNRKGSRGRLGWIVVGLAVLILALVGLLTRRPPREQSDPVSVASHPSGPSVLLITIDTVRADHVGCYGYHRIETPNIDSLAAQGVRFDDALVQVPLTTPSHSVILSGTYPMWNGVRAFDAPIAKRRRDHCRSLRATRVHNGGLHQLLHFGARDGG